STVGCRTLLYRVHHKYRYCTLLVLSTIPAAATLQTSMFATDNTGTRVPILPGFPLLLAYLPACLPNPFPLRSLLRSRSPTHPFPAHPHGTPRSSYPLLLPTAFYSLFPSLPFLSSHPLHHTRAPCFSAPLYHTRVRSSKSPTPS